LLGIVFGWLLARSRFGGWLALPYGLVIAVLIAVEGVGGVIPSLRAFLMAPSADVFEQMNLRVVSVSLRIGGWIETLRAGQNVQDQGLFVLLMSAVLAMCAIWLVWCLARNRNFLLGLLPIGLLYAINVHLSRQPLSYYMLFLFCGLLLISRTEYNRQHEEWERRRVDYPEQLGLEWAAAALVFALVIALVARAAPYMGTPEGWQVISEWVNRAHEETNTTATRLFSGVNPPPVPEGERVISVNTPNMARIGAPIPQGTGTIMWVKISDPPPAPSSAGINIPSSPVRVHYWRNGIFREYTGRGWEPAPVGGDISQPVIEEFPSPPPGRYYLRQVFELKARNTGALFAASEPVQVDRGIILRQAVPDQSAVLEGQASQYQVVSLATKVTANQLAGAPAEYPPAIRDAYLQLPSSLPGRVRTLAARITSGANDPYHKAIKIQEYLRENYQYDLTVQEAPPRLDVVDYFLFDVQAGFCSHYASAMAVMLRTVGVPARVASGYAMGSFDRDRQAFRVIESASHAWVEVYFPGYGWVEFEPTVARSAIEYVEEGSALGEPSGPDITAPEDSQPMAQPYFIALVLGGGLALLALPFLLLRLFSTRRQAQVIQVDALYRRIRRALRWAGLGAAGSVTPDEYLALYGARLEEYEQISEVLHKTTALYRESAYSPHPPDARRVRSASLLWQQSFGQWLTLWLRVTWKRLRAHFTD
jgi:hypothetical protein